MVIDHMDGDPFNNLVTNLKITNQKINTQNSKKGSKNTSGVTGVSEGDNGTGRAHFRSAWCYKTKQYSKTFSIDDLGRDKAFNMACAYRESKISELNSKGESYSDRHGL